MNKTYRIKMMIFLLGWFLTPVVAFSQQNISHHTLVENTVAVGGFNDLQEQLKYIPHSVIVSGQTVSLNHPDWVEGFYKNNFYHAVWNDDALITQLKQAVALSREDALNPLKYHQMILSNLQAEQATDYALEIVLTDAYLSLANDLANGIVDPKVTSPTWDAPKVTKQELYDWLTQASITHTVGQSLDRINADNARYQTLKMQYNAQTNLNHPLSINKTLGAGAVVEATMFDNDRLMINMERQRWLPQHLGESYIVVNIPAYQVDMYQNNQGIYHTAAVVGTPSRPTPRFTDNLRYVVMSPTWTVPPTIMKQDKLPQLKKNPQKFDRTYQAISASGEVVSPSSVDWKTSGSHYTLRQRPGSSNALGRVKFLFPNKYDIYLHDTPHKNLFKKDYRARSSGCVRLEKPEEFADILLKSSGWGHDEIKKAMARSSEKWAKLTAQIPIYLVYWTDWVDEKGYINQVNDVYKLDEKLINAYKRALN